MNSTAVAHHVEPTTTPCRPRRITSAHEEAEVVQPVKLRPGVLVLEQLQIAHLVFDADWLVDSELTGLLFIPDDRRLTLYDGTVLSVRAGDLVTVPMGGLLRDMGGRPLICTAVTGPRQSLGAIPSLANVAILPRSASVDALRRHVEQLQMMAGSLSDAMQEQFAVRSIRELLAAITVPVATQRRCGARREEALLNRILKHIDATLCQNFDSSQLCEVFACSRSALYRAMAPQGGLEKIVIHRRLMAVHNVLSRLDDRRSIAQIARAYGFSSASHFSRCFRRTFGFTAGGMRKTSGYR